MGWVNIDCMKIIAFYSCHRRIQMRWKTKNHCTWGKLTISGNLLWKIVAFEKVTITIIAFGLAVYQKNITELRKIRVIIKIIIKTRDYPLPMQPVRVIQRQRHLIGSTKFFAQRNWRSLPEDLFPHLCRPTKTWNNYSSISLSSAERAL